MLYDAQDRPIELKDCFDAFFKSTMKAYEKDLAKQVISTKTARDFIGINIYGPHGEVVANTGAKLISGGRLSCPVNR